MHSFTIVSVPRRHQGFNVEVLSSVTEQSMLKASERRAADFSLAFYEACYCCCCCYFLLVLLLCFSLFKTTSNPNIFLLYFLQAPTDPLLVPIHLTLSSFSKMK